MFLNLIQRRGKRGRLTSGGEPSRSWEPVKMVASFFEGGRHGGDVPGRSTSRDHIILVVIFLVVVSINGLTSGRGGRRAIDRDRPSIQTQTRSTRSRRIHLQFLVLLGLLQIGRIYFP
jgi:hypothetical protein